MSRFIPPHARSVLGAAVLVWSGCVVSLHPVRWELGAAGAMVAVAAIRRHPRAALGAALIAGGLLSGAAAASRATATLSAPIPQLSTVTFDARLIHDPHLTPFGVRVLVVVEDRGGDLPVGLPLMVEPASAVDAAARDHVVVSGRLRDRPGSWRGVPYRATVGDAEVEAGQETTDPVFRAGNGLRSFVLDRTAQYGPGPETALLAGFLVGETGGVPEADLGNLRRAGLSHFVAVSGSNVALFLAAWWLVVAPLGLGPRLRAGTGLVVLVVFVVATRWEPSVVRAATMAGLVLGGRMVGIPIDAWRALGSAVVALLLVSGQLATDVGFQLSAAATFGVLAGAHVAGRSAQRPGRTLLVATIGAQAAVLPVLLARFGTVPLLSPVANLLAAPLVTMATGLGALGLVVGIGPIVTIALSAARGVLVIADVAAGWPQLDVAGVAIVLVLAAASRFRKGRPAIAVAVAAGIVAFAWPVGPPQVPGVTFLDVGQGDAILLRDPSGATALVDGGHDPAVLQDALRRQGVARLDLLVATHGDADHVGGLDHIIERMPVGEVWYPDRQRLGEPLAALIRSAEQGGVPAQSIADGDQTSVGSISIRALGPLRRYGSDNDGSIVLLVSVGEMTVLLTGDVEAVAQQELAEVHPKVLQVPHHGSATTDLEWLSATVGRIAIVSVGDNTYGHPDPGVLDALEVAGARVWSTMRDGDVTIELCSPCGR